YTDDARGQVIFVDTPGVHAALDTLNQALVANAAEAVRGADAILLLVEATGLRAMDHVLLESLADRPECLVAVNKIDRAAPEQLAAVTSTLQEQYGVQPFGLSAAEGTGVEDLLDAIFAHLPEGPPLYDVDSASDRPVRFIVAEYIRQAMFELLREELPYEAFVEIEQFDESDDVIRIDAAIHVARKSQKGIVIGEGGQMIREIGTRARQLAEALLERRVFLKLFVKVTPKWMRNERILRELDVTRPGKKQARAVQQAMPWIEAGQQRKKRERE
ncbi:MAG: GTPase Era, partial [Candidatus Dadabacteria bacterium]